MGNSNASRCTGNAFTRTSLGCKVSHEVVHSSLYLMLFESLLGACSYFRCWKVPVNLLGGNLIAPNHFLKGKGKNRPLFAVLAEYH